MNSPSKENRAHERLEHAAEIDVSFPAHNEKRVAVTRDMSNGGLFINCPDHPEKLQKGDTADIAVIGIEDPITRSATVVRIHNKEGLAVEYKKETE